MKKLFLLLLISFVFFACKKEGLETKIFIVANKKIDVALWTGATVGCIQIKERQDLLFYPWFEGIKGFNYEEGFEYVIKVRVYQIDNPIDRSSEQYILEKIISKK